MTPSTTGCRVLDQEFLPLRAKLLEIAAMLDRIDRSGGTSEEDARSELIRQAIATLLRPDDDRAEPVAEGDDDVGGVPVEVLPAAVVDRGGPRVGVAGGDLDIA